MTSGTVTLRAFEAGDIDACHQLAGAVGWPYRRVDLVLMARLGSGLVACETDGSIVGVGLAWVHDDTAATVGMVIVRDDWQRRGVGRRVLADVLAGLGDRSVLLHATPAGLLLYRSLGFVEAGEIEQWQGIIDPAVTLSNHDAAISGSTLDHTTIMSLDATGFGAARPALLSALLRVGHVVTVTNTDGHCGFAIRRKFGRGWLIGPVVATDEPTAALLIERAAIPGFLRIDLARPSMRLASTLSRLGLTRVGGGIIMHRGGWPARRSDVTTWALASQAYG